MTSTAHERSTNGTRRIIVVGTGMLSPRDITAAGVEAIRSADVVVYSATWPGIKQWLSSLGGRQIMDISHLYQLNGVDSDNYDAILHSLLDLSREHESVTYLVPGTPHLGVSNTSALVQLARDTADLVVEVVPGVSSFDTIATDLDVDYLSRGTTVIDSNRLLMYRVKLDPTLGVLIYHPASVGNARVDYEEPWRSNNLALLQDYLLSTFDAQHPYYAVLSASAPGRSAEVTRGELGQLAADARVFQYGSSMYLPPSTDFDLDKEFVRRLTQTMAPA
ncbi:SAM-dependent methyltransferase [Streptomyces sp. G-G2]|uniref:SAM-dependent methyltransferase n=1 Tax=Streptomyces sp. G-G2 TaxID=3046201 RepID=UPI0024BBC428|nr:SAM-dependent methyltransferase [Streptomyces sp. G-G2]MDJ0386089.1 SAM-dependent methyltransferase [Streptomyces sp. G-G2]